MAISSLVVRTGIGSWGDIAHLITRGLDLGAAPLIWTPVTPSGGTWTPDSGNNDIWTPVTPASSSWA